MRLDDFDPNINVGDQRGSGGSGFGGFGGGGGLLFAFLPMIFNRFGCFGVAVVLGLFLFLGGGLNMLGGGGQMVGGSSTAPTVAHRSGSDTTAICTADAASKTACNAFSSADKTWAAILAKDGRPFEAPRLIFYSGDGQSACGAAQSAMGPFYCPNDQTIYLDTSFYDELSNKFGASGDFAQDYVIAHEFGHHIQKLLGISDKVSEMEARSSETEANKVSVMLELQADCFAGVWAAQNRDRMDSGDLQEGMTAAHAIGDDTLQQETQGRVVPDSFTHGTSAQRMMWLKRGIDTGDYRQCDTFQGALG